MQRLSLLVILELLFGLPLILLLALFGGTLGIILALPLAFVAHHWIKQIEQGFKKSNEG